MAHCQVRTEKVKEVSESSTGITRCGDAADRSTGTSADLLRKQIEAIDRDRPLTNKLRMLPVAALYRQWPEARTLQDGYTIVLATPSDLPVFIALAMETLKGQDLSHVHEIIVVPDSPDPRFTEFCGRLSALYDLDIPTRVADLDWRGRVAYRIARSPVMRHFTQVTTGIGAACTKYVLLHDADLFLPCGDFLRRQYETARDRQLSVYGVETRRTQSTKERTIVATWEMMLDVEWARAFPPYLHKGQDAIVSGHLQEFDTAILPQFLTAPDRIDFTLDRRFVHFRNVIATWRDYHEKRRLEPNWLLKLFLIRTLIDAFDRSGWEYPGLPTHQEVLDRNFGIAELRARPRSDVYIRDFLEEYGRLLELTHFEPASRQILAERVDALCRVLEVPTPTPAVTKPQGSV